MSADRVPHVVLTTILSTQKGQKRRVSTINADAAETRAKDVVGETFLEALRSADGNAEVLVKVQRKAKRPVK